MSNYFEATLQLRNIRKDILDFVNSEIKGKRMVVAKTEKQRNGIDIYLPSRSFAANLGKRLAGKFGGKFAISTRLFGRSKTGKTLYRTSVLYTAPGFSPGDIVEIDRKIMVLKSVGKFACGYDLVKRENAKIVIKGKKISKLGKFPTQVTKNYPNLEVLHPETYQSVPVLNPKQTRKSRVDVVIAEKGVYLAE